MPNPASLPSAALKGRGASRAIAHRFASTEVEAFDDGWALNDADCALPCTVVRTEQVRSAMTRNHSPDLGFERGLNPYRGCEHGCSYCYARPTHSYLGLSPGLDFETQLIAKVNIAQVLQQELQQPRYQPATLALGTVTDCYQPIEREWRLTRAVLQVLAQAHHPMAMVTKGAGIERDLDLLAPMAARGCAAVYVTLTTLDPVLARRLEPRAAAPHKRLRIIQSLAQAGVPVGVSLAPQIPFLNDDLEQCLAAAYQAGARRAFYAVLRLPWELSELFREWLQQHYPERAQRVMARIQDMRGGKDNDARFGHRQRGEGVWAQLLAQRFDAACRRWGFNREPFALSHHGFRPQALSGQTALFDQDGC